MQSGPQKWWLLLGWWGLGLYYRPWSDDYDLGDVVVELSRFKRYSQDAGQVSMRDGTGISCNCSATIREALRKQLLWNFRNSF